jgi:hypothetical protein
MHLLYIASIVMFVLLAFQSACDSRGLFLAKRSEEVMSSYFHTNSIFSLLTFELNHS